MSSDFQVSETVGSGHPDKIADTIADRFLEKLLGINPEVRLSCEVLASKNLIVIAGETSAVDGRTQQLAEDSIKETLEALNYRPSDFRIIVDLNLQSEDIASSSWRSKNGVVSGDQSTVIGFASKDTPNYLPLSYEVVKSIGQITDELIAKGELRGVKQDFKSLIVLKNREVQRLFFSIQHEDGRDLNGLREEIYGKIISKVLDEHGLSFERGSIKINNSERFVIGGLNADTGLTNRKIIVDSYGTVARNGGGGYSGKDLTKVDRLGAYYARWICKNFVASGVCLCMELELVFGYGDSIPSFLIQSVDSTFPTYKLLECMKELFGFSFEEIYHRFNIPGIRYSQLAKHGHFRNPDCPWEQLNMVDSIRKYLHG